MLIKTVTFNVYKFYGLTHSTYLTYLIYYIFLMLHRFGKYCKKKKGIKNNSFKNISIDKINRSTLS